MVVDSIKERTTLPQIRRMWFAPHNFTIQGDADSSGRLILGRIEGGGIPKDHLGKYPTLNRLIEALGKEYPILENFTNDIDENFWKFVPDRYAFRTALKVMELDSSLIPAGHIHVDREVEVEIKSSTGERGSIESGMHIFVYRDFIGSMLRTFELLANEHSEVRFIKSFGSKSGKGYALDYVYPKGAAKAMRTRYHGVKDFADEQLKRDDINEEKKNKIRACLGRISEFIKTAEGDKTRLILSSPNDKKKLEEYTEELIKELLEEKKSEIIKAFVNKFPTLAPEAEGIVEDYLKKTLPQIFLTEEVEELAEVIKYFLLMDAQTPRVVVAEPRVKDLEGNNNVRRIIVAIKEEKITPILVKICKILKERNIDIRYFLVESLPGSDGSNKTICKIGVRGKESKDSITLNAFKTVQGVIQLLGNPTFGTKSLLNDILGPIMIGPSSSHTAGACKIGRFARNFFEAFLKLERIGEAENLEIEVEMINTFSLNNTGAGHYSHMAVCGGLKNLKEDREELRDIEPPLNEGSILDVEINNAYIGIKQIISKDQDASVHPNTIRICMRSKGAPPLLEISGASVGGGIIALQSANGVNFEYEADAEAIRGDLPIYLIKFKEGKSVEDLQKDLEAKKISVVQMKQVKDPLALLCCREKIDKGQFNDIIENAEEVKGISDPRPSEDTDLPKFNSFSDILELVKRKPYENLSDLALDYEKGLLKKEIPELMSHMGVRLEAMFDAVEGGYESGSKFIVAGQKIGDLPRLLKEFASKLPFDKPYLINKINEIVRTEKTNEDIKRRLEGRNPLRPPFESYEDWAYIASDPLVREVFRKYDKDMRPATDEGFYDRLYEDIKKAWQNNPLTNIYSVAMAHAEAVNIYNAQMGKIVAAPTAGSAGVIPGALMALKEFYLDENGKEILTPEILTKALFTAALIGLVINDKVPTAGGTGGCQAELGAATAMAAGAAAELMGGTPEQVLQAVALILQQMEGQVCDPIAGFVAWPCIPRNGFSANLALAAAWQTVNLRKSLISPDAAVEAIKDTASKMHYTLKELGRDGGLAGTREGETIGEEMKKGCVSCKVKC